MLLLCWLLIFAIVTENFGKLFGIPYLFLDPEYMGRVNFWSFFVVGISLGGFIMAFHITCYIMDGSKYNFLGVLSRPFTKFSINNAVLPAAFIAVYIFCIVRFQINNEYNSFSHILIKSSGLLSGCLAMFILLYSYFRFTNKDIFKFAASNVDKRLKKTPLARGKLMARYKRARKWEVRVDNYLDVSLNIKLAEAIPSYLNKASILRVFDQNHLNSVIIESFALVLLLLLGLFREIAFFQIPAAASILLLFSVLIMLSGAISYWFKSWAVTFVIFFIFLLNFLVEKEVVTKTFKAYGLDYDKPFVDYSLANIFSINNSTNQFQDKAATLHILENWKRKHNSATKPKMVFICSSGGGQRAALWTFSALQAADSITGGRLMKNTALMTGASGGLIGSSYFRELSLQKVLGNETNPYAEHHRENIAKDILNPVIFSLVVNDLYFRYQHFDYGGNRYAKDRGYAFEEQLNINTGGVLDKPLGEYAKPEKESLIPMMIMAPTVVADGRKLFISPHHVSYMNLTDSVSSHSSDSKIKGMDFRYLFKEQRPDSLRFLTALRMSATFPYITPNVTLPTHPAIQIMDAGLSDNFGIGDAVGFLSVFRDWISENTSGVIILSLRDSEKNMTIEKSPSSSMFETVITPVSSLYNNWANIQDINNDNQIELARLWFEGDIYRIDLEYTTSTLFDKQPLAPQEGAKERQEKKAIERASLSWHLTTLEKQNIIDNINLPKNQKALYRLKKLLEDNSLRLTQE